MASALQEFLITLKEKVNIVDVASGYLSLERRGGSHWACCPFHHEKTPSFAINEADQYYHCFGCGESGDVIKFVCNMENVDFMDAVKILADKAGLTVPQTGFDNKQTAEFKRKRDAVLNILNECAHFYLKNLNSGNADEHIKYILNRKIPSDLVRKFGLGASLNFTDLPKYLLSKGFTKQDMLDSGAINEVDGRLTDAQGGRLIYPIINAMDEVIAFGGRLLVKKDFAKYKNTKETVVFNKSKTLYNINLLKKLKREQNIGEVIVVEGYMDTISVYGAGFKNVVASMGTSLTQEQARLIKRYTNNVLISYDGDGAGQKANMRGLEILKAEGLNVRVVPLPEGLDPDDVIKQYGAEGYQGCLNKAMPLIDFKLRGAKTGLDISKPEDKRQYVAKALKIIKTAESTVEQEDLLKALRDQTGITFESLKRDLDSTPQEVVKPQTEKPERRDVSSVAVRASRFVIAAYLFGAKISDEADITQIPFAMDVHDIIAKYVRSKKLLDERVRPVELFDFFEENSAEYEELTKILDYSDGDRFKGEVAVKYFFDCIKTLRLTRVDEEIIKVKKLAAEQTDAAARKALTEKLQLLIYEKTKIKNGD